MTKDIIKWFLGIISGLFLLLAGYVLSSIDNKIDDMSKEVTEIKESLGDGYWVDSLHVIRINGLRTDLDDHVKDEEKHR